MSLNSLFNQLLSSPGAKGALGGAASGAMVTALLNKKARKQLMGGAVKVGGLAALAGVGYVAYKKWQSMPRNTAAPHASSPLPSTPAPQPLAAAPALTAAAPAVSDSLAMKMLMAMIAAASADGRIDAQEMDQLFKAVDSADLTSSEHDTVMAALNAPPSIDAICEGIADPESAAEVFGAAAMAIDNDTPAEQFFLKRLARRLQIDPQLEAMILEAEPSA